MNTIYLEPEIYDKIETVESFPNPDVKIGIFGGDRCRLYKTCVMKVETMTADRTKWFVGDKQGDFVMVTASNGHFPTNIVCGTQNGMYNATTELAKLSGYVQSFGTGTGSQCFLEERFFAKGGGRDLLAQNGFFFENILN